MWSLNSSGKLIALGGDISMNVSVSPETCHALLLRNAIIFSIIMAYG
jgi:hypothetical protein